MTEFSSLLLFKAPAGFSAILVSLLALFPTDLIGSGSLFSAHLVGPVSLFSSELIGPVPLRTPFRVPFHLVVAFVFVSGVLF